MCVSGGENPPTSAALSDAARSDAGQDWKQSAPADSNETPRDSTGALAAGLEQMSKCGQKLTAAAASRAEAKQGEAEAVRGRPKPSEAADIITSGCLLSESAIICYYHARARAQIKAPSACSRRAPPPPQPPTSMSAPEATRASPLERVAGGSHLIWRRLRARPLACRRAPDLRAQINNKLARRLAAARSCRQLDLPVVCGLILGACDRLDSSLGLRLAGFGRDFSSWTKREREPGRLFEATFWGQLFETRPRCVWLGGETRNETRQWREERRRRRSEEAPKEAAAAEETEKSSDESKLGGAGRIIYIKFAFHCWLAARGRLKSMGICGAALLMQQGSCKNLHRISNSIPNTPKHSARPPPPPSSTGAHRSRCARARRPSRGVSANVLAGARRIIMMIIAIIITIIMIWAASEY